MSLPEDALSYLTGLAVEIGAARMRELVLASPAAHLLLPFTTALGQELGMETRVALEVEEVAKDIRMDLQRRSAERSDEVQAGVPLSR